MYPDVDYLVWAAIDTNTLYSENENEPKMAATSKFSWASAKHMAEICQQN